LERRVYNKIPAFTHYGRCCLLPFDVVMVDSEAGKKRLSFKDALLNKYSVDEDEDLCFIDKLHISGSPNAKGKLSELMLLKVPNCFLCR